MQERGIKPELEVFNSGQLNEVYRLIEDGLLDPPYYINLIFGGRAFTLPRPKNVLNLVDNLPPDAEFNLLATGRHQLPLTTLGILLGGHVRVGLEDNLYYSEERLAESNAELVERTVDIAELLGRDVATPDEARTILDIE
jgi:3-keto-5-aminohexanoate cleavage enzyme